MSYDLRFLLLQMDISLKNLQYCIGYILYYIFMKLKRRRQHEHKRQLRVQYFVLLILLQKSVLLYYCWILTK